MFCSCILFVVGVFVLYKLIDRLLRLPRIGNYGDRWVLVTGCDTGFGKMFAKRLDDLGCHVFAGCLTEKGETELKKIGSERLHVFPLDVTNRESVQKALEFVKSKLPQGKGLWGVMNNAGTVSALGPTDWLRLEEYERQLSVNLFGVIDVTHTFLPLIKAAKGRVVNTASVAGRICLPDLVPYCIAKYGVEAFTDGLRRDMRAFGCKAILIEPGVHMTPLANLNGLIKTYRRMFEGATPEVQKEYGRDFLNFVASAEGLRPLLSAGSERVTDVIDAYEHALLGVYPRARYLVGWDANFVYLPIQHLPEWLGDWVFEKLNPNRPRPACVKKN